MNTKISSVELKLVAPQKKAIELGTHTGLVHEGLVLCRIRSDDGLTGMSGLTTYTETAVDRSIFEAAKNVAPHMIGISPMHIEKIHSILNAQYNFLKSQCISLFDIALWDLAAKRAELPLYEYIGAAKTRIPAYASLPMFPDVNGYLDYLKRIEKKPYRNVKIHPFCQLTKDLELIDTLSEKYGRRFGFYFDTEQQYGREEALQIGKQLERHSCFLFFEAPISDHDVEGYKWLRSKLDIPILQSGIEIFSPHMIAHLIQQRVCDRLRFDVTLTGGVTTAQKLLGLADSANLKTEIQSWGYLITQAANLHVMLSTISSSEFEQAMPFEPYEWGALTTLRMDDEGFISPPNRPGLGIEYDWDLVDRCTMSQMTYS